MTPGLFADEQPASVKPEERAQVARGGEAGSVRKDEKHPRERIGGRWHRLRECPVQGSSFLEVSSRHADQPGKNVRGCLGVASPVPAQVEDEGPGFLLCERGEATVDERLVARSSCRKKKRSDLEYRSLRMTGRTRFERIGGSSLWQAVGETGTGRLTFQCCLRNPFQLDGAGNSAHGVVILDPKIRMVVDEK
jgi:hypothetical protein